MKKIILIFLFSFFLLSPISGKTLQGGVSLSWDGLSETEILQDILDVKFLVFEGREISDKKGFKQIIKPYKKDNNNKDNYMFALSGGGELSDKIVVPFFYKKILYAYGIIYKDDKRTCYYYNAMGSLFSVEYFDKDYGDFPVTSYKYKVGGKLNSAVYNVSENDQYIYKKNGSFVGRWHNENYYDGKGKIVLTRNLPQN